MQNTKSSVNLQIVMLSLFPFLLGWILNGAITELTWFSIWSFRAFEIMGLLAWAWLAHFGYKKTGSVKQTMILQHIVPVITLLLIAFQLLYLHRFFDGMAGLLTQFYFLPWLRLGYFFSQWSQVQFPAFCICFLVLLVCSYLGCRFAKANKEIPV